MAHKSANLARHSLKINWQHAPQMLQLSDSFPLVPSISISAPFPVRLRPRQAMTAASCFGLSAAIASLIVAASGCRRVQNVAVNCLTID